MLVVPGILSFPLFLHLRISFGDKHAGHKRADTFPWDAPIDVLPRASDTSISQEQKAQAILLFSSVPAAPVESKWASEIESKGC